MKAKTNKSIFIAYFRNLFYIFVNVLKCETMKKAQNSIKRMCVGDLPNHNALSNALYGKSACRSPKDDGRKRSVASLSLGEIVFQAQEQEKHNPKNRSI